MTTITHEAFIDLEVSLVERVFNGWLEDQDARLKRIERLVKRKKWDDAHDEVNKISFEKAVDESTRYLEVVGMAAVLLGASRISGSEDSFMGANPPREILETARTQVQTVLLINAQESLRTQAHQMVEAARKASLEAETVQKADSQAVRVAMQIGGKTFVDISSSMYVSRLSSFGFLGEAAFSGATEYVINEVMDSKTCPVCQTMNGKTFSVADGLRHAMELLSLQDPNDIKQSSPWPSQSRANVERLGKMSSTDMMNAGLDLPPYHPMCRGIITATGSFKVPALPTLATLQTAAEEAADKVTGNTPVPVPAAATAPAPVKASTAGNEDRKETEEERTEDAGSFQEGGLAVLLQSVFPSLFK